MVVKEAPFITFIIALKYFSVRYCLVPSEDRKPTLSNENDTASGIIAGCKLIQFV